MTVSLQARWFDDSSLRSVPHIEDTAVAALESSGIDTLPQMISAVENKPDSLCHILSPVIGDRATAQAIEARPLPCHKLHWDWILDVQKNAIGEGAVQASQGIT